MSDDLDRVYEALDFIPADCDRLAWVRIGMAIKSKFRGNDGRDAFLAWSKKGASKYDKYDAKTVWKTAKPKRINIGALFNEAKKHGWEPRKDGRPYVRPPAPEPGDDDDDDEPEADDDERAIQAWALALWDRGRPIGGTLVERYLSNRGIVLAPDLLTGEVLRFLPNCPFGEHGRHPAMLAPYRSINGDELLGLHRTALLRDGSDRIRKERDGWKGKKMAGPISHACIKLCPDDEVEAGLGLSEGIENGLAMISMGWRPVWVAGCDWALGAFPVLSGIESLTVFGDDDEAGKKAALEVQERWLNAGREVRLRIAEGGDWNDILRRESP